MIFLAVEPYDPDPVEGATSQASSHYLTKKDFKWIVVVLVVLGAVLSPIYNMALAQRNEYVCKQNLKEIWSAMGIYAQANDDKFPPVFMADQNGNPTIVNGAAVSWVSLVQPEMKNRASFVCPASDKSERSTNLSLSNSNAVVESSYGMYAPYGAFPESNVADPDLVALVGETANAGANNTADPDKFMDGGKPIAQDGFCIGFNDSNDDITHKSKYISRLAFPGTADGAFAGKTEGRHEGGIFVITAGGETIHLTPKQAQFSSDWVPGKPEGIWAVPAGYTK